MSSKAKTSQARQRPETAPTVQSLSRSVVTFHLQFQAAHPEYLARSSHEVQRFPGISLVSVLWLNEQVGDRCQTSAELMIETELEHNITHSSIAFIDQKKRSA